MESERTRGARETIDLAWQFIATARRDFVPGDDDYLHCIESAEDLLWQARKEFAATPIPSTEANGHE